MASGIYCIENIVNNKKYIGQSKVLEQRLNRIHNNCPYIYSAEKKHGKENFKRFVILYCEQEELNYYEAKCIKAFHSHFSENGYNISWGGDASMAERTHSEKSKEKMRKPHSKFSQEIKDRMSKSFSGRGNPNFGKKHGKSSKFFGVCASGKGYWLSQITLRGKLVYIGTFKKEEDAAQKYNEFVIENKIDRPLNKL